MSIKINKILDYCLKNSQIKLDKKVLETILKIDKKFDLNRFEEIPIKIIYNDGRLKDKLELHEIKNTNCIESTIKMIGFKLGESNKLLNDYNIFCKNINNVTFLISKSWRGTIDEYYVKHLQNNNKTFRFMLHSYTNKVSNQKNQKYIIMEDYYIDGNPIEKYKWLKYSREFKLNRILKK